jgi:hypothetical protein
VFWNLYSADQWQAAQHGAPILGVRLAGIGLREPPYDYEAALAQAPPDRRRAPIVTASPVFPNTNHFWQKCHDDRILMLHRCRKA